MSAKRTGFIYRIFHHDQNSGENIYSDKSYIGQTHTSLEQRFKEHLRAAQKYSPNIEKPSASKGAKLYEAMRIIGTDHFKIEELDRLTDENFESLSQQLDQSERFYILHYNSIKNGWNKVLPSGEKKVRSSSESSIKTIADKYGIPYTTLLNRLKKSDKQPEQIAKEIASDPNRKIVQYVYGRKFYDNIRELSEDKRINPENLKKKTIERRIKLQKANNPETVREGDQNTLIIDIMDEVFAPKKQGRKEIKLSLPNGLKLKGNLTTLHDICRKEFPDITPKSFTTVQARLSGRQTIEWTPEEAFGFNPPPNYREVSYLVSDEGYKWMPDAPLDNVGVPVVVHAFKEVYVSQSHFGKEFKIQPDMVSDYFKAGMTVDDILRKFKII